MRADRDIEIALACLLLLAVVWLGFIVYIINQAEAQPAQPPACQDSVTIYWRQFGLPQSSTLCLDTLEMDRVPPRCYGDQKTKGKNKK